MPVITIDDISFEIKTPKFNFDFLHDYGKVFTVFDKNDSGNISFGVDNNGKKFFIKVGGVQTLYMDENHKIESVISSLIYAADIYKTLRHQSLINLIDNKEIQNGYILVFDWINGECMNEHWTYDKIPKYTHEKSAFYRYIRLEQKYLIKSINEIFEFHQFIASKNYVAIDFYDGSVMYDFVSNKTTICDIDFYSKSPYINNMGRLWGSSMFMSPEEFTKGSIIDEITNVYTIGATAFVFLGGEKDRSFSKWRAGKNLYEVALKAVEPDRKDRYKSINDFIQDWNEALILDGAII